MIMHFIQAAVAMDWTISIGTIIHLITLLLALIAAWFSIRGRLEVLEKGADRVEKQLEKTVECVNELSEQIAAHAAILSRKR